MSSASPDLSAMSPGTRTDLEVLRMEGALIEPRDGYVVVRSPDQPTYHWGNCLYLTTGDVEDAPRWLATFHEELPDVTWLACGLPTMPQGDAWQQEGLTPEGDDVLSMRGLPQTRPLPDGYTVRALTSDDDWEQQIAMDLRDHATEVPVVSESHQDFTRKRADARRRIIERGDLIWLGAFTADNALAASLGIAVLGEDHQLARYQSVLTDGAHRRKGLAGHLLGEAAQWAAGRGAQEFVIVTELTNPAGRLYRSVGFTPDLPAVGVYKAPAE